MRILFLSSQLAGSPSAYGSRLAGLRRGLESEGVSTDLLSLRTLRFSRPNLLFALNARTIAAKARGCEAIHAANMGPAVAAATAGLWNRHRVILDVHGDELQEAQLDWQARPSARRAYLVLQAMLLTAIAHRAADMLLVVSEPFRERYRTKGIPSEKIALVRNGVDTSVFKSLPPRSAGRLNICYAGSFHAWQAVDVLVEALAKSSDDRLAFHFIGFSPQDQPLKATIAARLGGRATLEDWLPTDRLVERLGQADILVIPRTVHPAMRGGCPTKFAEYLAMGRPLIVTDVDETACFVRASGCGLVCEPTADDLARAIRQAASWSEYERRSMGQRARELAESVFDWRIIARHYLRTLQGLVR